MVISAALSLAAAVLHAESSASAQVADANPMGIFVDHVVLGVADLEKQTEWYRRVLGFQVGTLIHRVNRDVQHISIPGFGIYLVRQNGSTRPTPFMDADKQGLSKVVFGTRDADAAYRRLVALGVKVNVSRDEQGKVDGINVIDPEGNALEIQK
jgi:catechol 2,3-dioxygenase-like lactoylglutathione lyase family enzyme